MENVGPPAPRHPRINRRSLIWSPGYHSGLSVKALDRRVVGAIAHPLPLAVLDPKLISDSLSAGLGVILPTEGWRNQLPAEHPKRAGAFAHSRIHRPGLVYDPDRQPLGGARAEAYVVDDQAAQVEAQATLVLTPGHVLEFECADGRRGELLLARLAVEEFEAAQRAQPAPGRSERRELYATIVVQGAHAAVPWIVERLAQMYAELEGVGGYWVVGANVNRSARQRSGLVRLALMLQHLSGRPAVPSRLGDEHLAALASGAAATCAGLHAMTFKFPPDVIGDRGDAEETGDETETGVGVFTYCRAVLGNAGPLGAQGDALRAKLFAAYSCGCGSHDPRTPPRGKAQIVWHNAWSIAQDANLLAVADVSDAEERLGVRAAAAKRRRRNLKMSALRPGFRAIPEEARKLRLTFGEPDARAASDEA